MITFCFQILHFMFDMIKHLPFFFSSSSSFLVILYRLFFLIITFVPHIVTYVKKENLNTFFQWVCVCVCVLTFSKVLFILGSIG